MKHMGEMKMSFRLSMLSAIYLSTVLGYSAQSEDLKVSSGNPEIDSHFQSARGRHLHTEKQIAAMTLLFRELSEKNFDKASTSVENQLRTQVIFPWMYACRSRIKLQKGLLDESLTDAYMSVWQDKKYDVCYAARGQALLALAIREKSVALVHSALDDLSIALSLAKNRFAKSEYHLSKAQCYLFIEKWEDALRETNKSIALAKTNAGMELLAKINNHTKLSFERGTPNQLFAFEHPDWRRLE